MIKLAELKEKLAELQGMMAAADNGKRFAARADQVEGARIKAAGVLLGESAANEALPGDVYRSAAERVRRACKAAGALRDKLKEAPTAIAENAWAEKIDKLCNEASSAHASFSEAWKRGIDSKVREKKPLVDMAVSIKHPSSRELQTILRGLDRDVPAPSSVAEGRKIKEQLARLNELLAEIKLDGAFGAFIESAKSPEGADLKDVLNPEIQERLTHHKVWKSFRVKLI